MEADFFYLLDGIIGYFAIGTHNLALFVKDVYHRAVGFCYHHFHALFHSVVGVGGILFPGDKPHVAFVDFKLRFHGSGKHPEKGHNPGNAADDE